MELITQVEENEHYSRAHLLAQKCEGDIKEAIVQAYGADRDDLEILLKEKEGVYFSQEEPDCLCCLVIGEKSGFLYVVAAQVTGSEELANFKVAIVS